MPTCHFRLLYWTWNAFSENSSDLRGTDPPIRSHLLPSITKCAARARIVRTRAGASRRRRPCKEGGASALCRVNFSRNWTGGDQEEGGEGQIRTPHSIHTQCTHTHMHTSLNTRIPTQYTPNTHPHCRTLRVPYPVKRHTARHTHTHTHHAHTHLERRVCDRVLVSIDRFSGAVMHACDRSE